VCSQEPRHLHHLLSWRPACSCRACLRKLRPAAISVSRIPLSVQLVTTPPGSQKTPPARSAWPFVRVNPLTRHWRPDTRNGKSQ